MDLNDWINIIRNIDKDLFDKSPCLFVEGKDDALLFGNILNDKSVKSVDDNPKNVSIYFYDEEYVSCLEQNILNAEEKLFANKGSKVCRVYSHANEMVMNILENFDRDKSYKKILEAYGIIDRDFWYDDAFKKKHASLYSKKTLFNKNYLSVYESRDLESTIIKYYLPDYVEGSENMWSNKYNYVDVDDIYNHIIFFIEQGIMQKVSFENIKSCDEDTNKFFIQFTLKNFDNSREINKFDGIYKERNNFGQMMNKSFADAVKELKGYRPCEELTNEYYNKCILYATSIIPKFACIEFKNAIEKWIYKDDLSDEETKLIDDAFMYTNGHYLYNYLVYKRLLPKDEDNDFIINYIAKYKASHMVKREPFTDVLNVLK